MSVRDALPQVLLSFVLPLEDLEHSKTYAKPMVDSAGEANRSTSSHALNSASSRSHTVFTIHMQMRMLGEGEERAVTSKLNLVDLAGSERTKKTGVTGQALKVEHCLCLTMFACQLHTSS